jgi:uncharacterized membrane protein
MNSSEAAATTNLTLKEYLESQLGVQTLPLPVVVPLTVLFVLISITGIVGNFMVCMVIAKHPSMHTATNYYLFSLAVSDITILVFGEYIFMQFKFSLDLMEFFILNETELDFMCMKSVYLQNCNCIRTVKN